MKFIWNMSKKIIEKYGLAVILSFFILMGVTGIFYSFSMAYAVGDESAITSAALKMIAEMNFRPNYFSFYYFPVAVYLYLPFIALLMIFFRTSGLFSSIEQIKEFGTIDFGKLLPFSRLITVFIGVLCIYLTFRITEKLFKNRWISLLAGWLLASSLMFVQMSHFARVWVPQVFFILLAFDYFAGLLAKEKITLKNYIISAILIALSFGTHTIGIVVYASFFCLLLIRHDGTIFEKFIKNKNFWLANLVILLLVPVIYFLNPGAFYRYGFYIASVANQGVATAGQSLGVIGGATYYIRILFEHEPLLLTAFGLSALVLFFKKRRCKL